MGAALVLNATYEPLCVVPLRRAVVLVLAEKAVVVEAGELVMHSERLAVPDARPWCGCRASCACPYRREVPLTRRAVLDRDAHACVYCGLRADTIDHVRPRSRGGQHVWTNVVAACARCNHRKGDRLLTEIGWTLPRRRCSRRPPSPWSWAGPRATRPGTATWGSPPRRTSRPPSERCRQPAWASSAASTTQSASTASAFSSSSVPGKLGAMRMLRVRGVDAVREAARRPGSA